MEEVVNPYHDNLSQLRKGLLIKGPWRESYARYVEKNSIKALYFNSARGWRGEDFSFLSELNGIEEISIICSKISNLSSIERIKSLQEISLNGIVTEDVKLCSLPRLKKCYLYWWTGAKSVLESVSLESAYFDKLRLKAYDELAELRSVRHLTIANSSMPDIEWLNRFTGQLEELHLLNCKKLECFSALSTQTNLKRLTISGSKFLGKIDFVSALRNLEVLDLSDSGPIKDIRAIVELKELKAFALAGSNSEIENGDLSALSSLPKLAMVMLAPRKHYTHRLVKKWDWKNFNTPDKLLEKIGTDD